MARTFFQNFKARKRNFLGSSFPHFDAEVYNWKNGGTSGEERGHGTLERGCEIKKIYLRIFFYFWTLQDMGIQIENICIGPFSVTSPT